LKGIGGRFLVWRRGVDATVEFCFVVSCNYSRHFRAFFTFSSLS
jgi:hypothetical protein